MRLFINTEITNWQTLVHLTTCSRLYAGKWNDYYIYKILKLDSEAKLHIHSFAPIGHLSNNYEKLYCYNKLLREYQLEKYNRILVPTIIYNSFTEYKDPEKGPKVYVPDTIEEEDRIIIYNPNYTGKNECINPIEVILQ